MSNSEILKVENLTVRLGEQSIIEDVSFTVKAGSFMTIIGPNGSGKTTLFRALINTVPYSGKVTWASGTAIGYVPQKLDIERNVPLSLRDFLESKNKTAGAKELEENMRLVGLTRDFLGKPLGALSGGEFQRALVAFALIGKTNVLLFDEPTAGIDQPSEEQIYETMHRLQDERGLTIITISHDLSMVSRYADKVLCLNKRNLCFGEPEDVLKAENLTHLYGAEHQKFFHHQHDLH